MIDSIRDGFRKDVFLLLCSASVTLLFQILRMKM